MRIGLRTKQKARRNSQDSSRKTLEMEQRWLFYLGTERAVNDTDATHGARVPRDREIEAC
jgi:hypothetical protein